MIEKSFLALADYCRKNDFTGWNVFDGLNSKLFINSPFYRSKLFRLAWIQFFKHSPINLRKFVLVPKGLNPKGLGLFAHAFLDAAAFLFDDVITQVDALRADINSSRTFHKRIHLSLGAAAKTAGTLFIILI